MKNKIFISTLLFITLFLTLVIPCFAYDFNGVLVEGDILLFNETISSDAFNSPISLNFYSGPTKQYFNYIKFSYPGRLQMSYYSDEESQTILVYDAESGWTDESYRTLLIDMSIVLSGQELGFVSVNATLNPNNEGLYDTVYNFIKPTIFGDREPDGAENFVLILLVSIFTLGFIILPLIIVWLIIKGILSASRGVWG